MFDHPDDVEKIDRTRRYLAARVAALLAATRPDLDPSALAALARSVVDECTVPVGPPVRRFDGLSRLRLDPLTGEATETRVANLLLVPRRKIAEMIGAGVAAYVGNDHPFMVVLALGALINTVLDAATRRLDPTEALVVWATLLHQETTGSIRTTDLQWHVESEAARIGAKAPSVAEVTQALDRLVESGALTRSPHDPDQIQVPPSTTVAFR